MIKKNPKKKEGMIEHRTLDKRVKMNNPTFINDNFITQTGVNENSEDTNFDRFVKKEKIYDNKKNDNMKERNLKQEKKENINQINPKFPKEIYEISPIIKNLYLSGKHGEQFYKNYDVIINLNYPENRVPKGCMIVDKAKVYRLGIEDSHVEDLYTYFDILSSLILTSLKKNKKVLVHCAAGISRSVSGNNGIFY